MIVFSGGQAVCSSCLRTNRLGGAGGSFSREEHAGDACHAYAGPIAVSLRPEETVPIGRKESERNVGRIHEDLSSCDSGPAWVGCCQVKAAGLTRRAATALH